MTLEGELDSANSGNCRHAGARVAAYIQTTGMDMQARP